MAERAPLLRNRKVWLIAVALTAAAAGFALAMLAPHRGGSGDADNIGGLVAAFGGFMAAVSAAAHRRRRSKENLDG